MTQKRYPLLGLLGGTFDPVHNGHIAIAQHCITQYNMKSIQFIPNHNHHHKPNVKASASHRVNMLKLAITGHKEWQINTMELSNSQPAYSIETVKQLGHTFPDHALCFILSVESFNSFNTWKNYREITDHCHLIILGRSNHTLASHSWQLQLLSHSSIEHQHQLQNSMHGKIVLDPYNPPAVTSTDIRTNLNTKKPTINTSPAVRDYIKTHDLYR